MYDVLTLWYYDLLLFTSDQEIPTASISNMDTEEIEAVKENESERSERNTGNKTHKSIVEENNETNMKSIGTICYHKLRFSFFF